MSASLRQVNISVRAENRASFALRSIAFDVVHLGVAFGALNNDTARMMSVAFSAIRILTSLRGVVAALEGTQKAHNVAVATNAALQGAAATATTGETAATVVNTSATGIASTVLAVYNAHKAAFLVMTGVGITLVLAAAAAFIYFNNQVATASMNLDKFGSSWQGWSPSGFSSRQIERAGTYDFRRRGIE